MSGLVAEEELRGEMHQRMTICWLATAKCEIHGNQ